MKASDATSNDQNYEKRQAHGATFAKVLDGRKQPIRGLWIRGTRYYGRGERAGNRKRVQFLRLNSGSLAQFGLDLSFSSFGSAVVMRWR
jgi:hypothetical protein